jgi:hypothetical protein
MTDSKDDPRPMIDGTNEVVDAVLDHLIAPITAAASPKPSIKKPDIPAVPTLMNRFLERVPAELRDKVTIQIGATKVKRPGQEAKLNAKQQQAIAAALDDPTKHKGSLKILGEKNEVLMLLADSNFAKDKIGFSQKQELKLDAPVEAVAPEIAPEITPAIATSELTASPNEVSTLIATIERLESRVAALEAKIEPQPVKLKNNIVGNWLNTQRDKIAEVVRTNVDKVSVRGHAIADKIAATKQSVTNTVVTAANDIKQSAVDAKATVIEGADLVKNVAVQGAQQIITDGMSRHFEAMDAMSGQINQSASSIADNARDVIEDPRQAFIDKSLQPVAQRMFDAAEKMDRVTVGIDGNKSVSVGPYTYSKEQNGIVMKREGQVVTSQNLTQKDVQAVNQMQKAFPKPEIKPKIVPQKITGPKHKVSV